MIRLSAVVLAKNEERQIEECLSCLSFADEIVVIDDESTDKTVRIANQAGARVYKHKLDDFAGQRDFALSKVRGEWVLFVDADERVGDKLRQEIVEAVAKEHE